MQALSDDLLDGAAEAAEYLGLSRWTVFRLAKAGDIPSVKKGGRIFFRKSELDRAFSSNATADESADERAVA